MICLKLLRSSLFFAAEGARRNKFEVFFLSSRPFAIFSDRIAAEGLHSRVFAAFFAHNLKQGF